MMTTFKTKTFLKENEFEVYKRGVRIKDLITTFVYVIKGTESVYIHECCNPNYYLKKHLVWLNRRRTDRLPKVVEFNLPPIEEGTSDQDMDALVTLYFKQGVYDRKEVKDVLNKQVGVLHKRDIKIKTVCVMIVSTELDPDYYRVVQYSSSSNQTVALSKFIYNATERHKASTNVLNKEYTKWCVRNRHALRGKRVVVNTLIENKPVEEARVILQDYIDSSNGICLNVIIPLLSK